MLFNDKKYKYPGTFLVVQWLRLCASIVVGMGSIPDQGTRTPTVVWHSKTNLKTKFILECSLTGFLCPWDSPAKILEWVAMSFSKILSK